MFKAFFVFYDTLLYQHFFNDYYCKDLSRKVKSGLKTLWESGKDLSSFGVYGYKKSKENKHLLEVDEKAAEIVRRIFNLAISGKKPTQIAQELNYDKIVMPFEYLCQNYDIKHKRKKHQIWTSTSIIRIIKDVRYLGTVVSGKTAVASIASKSKVLRPQSDWYISENMHTPLISKKDYEKAQNTIREIKGKGVKRTSTPSPHSLPIKVICSGCNYSMSKNGAKKMAYYCKYKNFTKDNDCFSDKIEIEKVK